MNPRNVFRRLPMRRRALWFFVLILAAGAGCIPENLPITPEVLSVLPQDGATGVPVVSTVTVNFTTLMDMASAEAAFSISPTTAGTFQWNESGGGMTFVPDDALAATTEYTATLAAGALSLDGEIMEGPFTWSFTTGLAPDGVAPVGSITSPADSATGLGVTATTVTVAFSEPMNPSSVEGAFSLAPSAAGTFSWNGTDTEVTFTPPVVGGGTTYTVTVTSGARDVSGEPMAAGITSSFTTVTCGDDAGGGRTYCASWAYVQPTILQVRCVSCHHQGHPTGLSWAFDQYDAIVPGPRAGSGYVCENTYVIVVPGDSAGSLMAGKVSPSPPCGSRMPFGGPYLTQAQIDQIGRWIDEGAEALEP